MRSLLLAAALLLGCSSAERTGEVVVTAYGEPVIEEGMTTSDGWAIKFTRFEVTLDAVGVDGRANHGARVVELVSGRKDVATLTDVPARRHGDFRFTVLRVAIAGVARKDAQTKPFAWTVETEATYSGCQPDLVVRDNGVERVELTFHGDHLFDGGHDGTTAFEPAPTEEELESRVRGLPHYNGEGECTKINAPPAR